MCDPGLRDLAGGCHAGSLRAAVRSMSVLVWVSAAVQGPMAVAWRQCQ